MYKLRNSFSNLSCLNNDANVFYEGWDDRLSEQRRASRESSTSSLYSIPQTTSTVPEKRRRRTGKRDDRTQPKAVQPLPRRPDGTIALPVTIGRGTNEVIIYNIGTIVCDREGFHNPRYIWPVGFKSKKYLPSLTTPSKKTGYISEILDGGNAPIFQVTPEDSPTNVFSGASASGVWKQLLDQIASLGVTAKTHASGPEMLGLSNLAVTKAIQELPDADKCTRYVPQRWLDHDQFQDQENDASSPHESSSLYIVHEQPPQVEGSDRSL
ncbi:F/Y rich C-terminus-domain-containing protein [Umbelopsis sp. PMI_123]|nr:F/Y rich C-terminus-domain-containing protein [Umbelopsis sp. PMI_123]